MSGVFCADDDDGGEAGAGVCKLLHVGTRVGDAILTSVGFWLHTSMLGRYCKLHASVIGL